MLDVEGTTTLHQTTVSDNTAVLDGGGVAVADSQLTLKDATVVKNSAAGVGGGLAVTFDSVATIENSRINDNTAGFSGAGLYNEDSVTTLRDSEVVGNRAVGPFGRGGGIFNTEGGEVTLHRTKVAHNFSTLAAGGHLQQHRRHRDAGRRVRGHCQPPDQLLQRSGLLRLIGWG